MSFDYKSAGVDVDAGNELVHRIAPVAKATQNQNVLGDLGGFAAAYRLPEITQPTLVSATDGVGTKLLLALQCDQHDTIGIDLVAMVANDLIADGAKPLFFLDYLACDQLDVDQVETIVKGIAYGCEMAGMSLIGGETAEMPGMYPQHHYDLAGFAVGLASQDKLLPQGVKAGDKLIGLPSSGVHSNGFSLVRRLLAETNLASMPLADGTEITTALLAPTRIYVKTVLPLIQAGLIHGAAHITGGGFEDNVPRMLPKHLAAAFDVDSWQWPELFSRLQEAGDLSLATMRRTFNCGIGMVLAVDPQDVDTVLAQNPHSKVIGDVIERTQDAVVWR
ncbi:phosphoribosylformylglycinamidine cyclo-ligase [Lacticaseibacillus manihotivorans]|jgi:phosphoribosylformylglycinamidine cyclo-ligase|uniref:Phosphoribosylformylglycinamidine cyclo-ligase n=2 Tax=Lacticaseibacillus manihotivorans TaxID=88233 RepID=A0A0R1RF30_9LACO|nr:phosphoribosylformylglycinamidine cyclo-ligase [Lacticaseibacillus manihotivorans]KRL52123.1 phosphoribosylformylglycinamidine cyclo-ligase [Lacticaseibacillus manihotivorans DSM 13343 = JCM 12514]QFQ91638.1 phosphoribosylformylglycinamidine cyclo-ligase [Lacticaseibacillus manihotivorans]